MSTRQIDRRIGISTDALFDVTLDEAIASVSESGFDTFEIVPADFQGAGGFPFTGKNPGVRPGTFDKSEREHLKKKLSCFSQVTVHAPHIGVNIGSRNPGWKEESVRQYLECIEFARDIGAKIVSFHHAGIGPSVEFAKTALSLAYKYELYLAFENGLSISGLAQTLEEINDKRFGLLLDVGHAANGRLEVGKVIDKFAGKLFEIHASGVYRGDSYFPPDGWGIDHFPLEMNDYVDYPMIMEKLKGNGYRGPIILEICYARTVNDIIAYCKRAKEEISSCWNQV